MKEQSAFQSQKQNSNFTEFDLGNGESAISLIPKIHGKLAIVDFETLKRISQSLQKVPFDVIKHELQSNIERSTNLVEMNEVLKNEVNFHETINLIKTIEI